MFACRKSISRIIALSILLILPSLGTSMQEAHARISAQGTTLQGAKIQGTRLQGTRLQGTRLQGTRLQGTRLQGTRLQGAKIQGTELQTPVTDGHWLRGPRLIGVLTHAVEGARWQLAPCTRTLPDDERASESAWPHVWSQPSATQDAWPAD
jgi:hypothetical protein